MNIEDPAPSSHNQQENNKLTPDDIFFADLSKVLAYKKSLEDNGQDKVNGDWAPEYEMILARLQRDTDPYADKN